MTDGLILVNRTPATDVGNLILEPGVFELGRSKRCDLLVKHQSVSRRHAQLQTIGDRVEVADLKSRNGTFVNGVRVETVHLGIGMTIRFGRITYQLCRASDVDQEELSDPETETTHFLDGPDAVTAAIATLSFARRRVLTSLVRGLAEKSIATKLHLSRHTVHDHVGAIYRHFGVHSRPELLALFVNPVDGVPPASHESAKGTATNRQVF